MTNSVRPRKGAAGLTAIGYGSRPLTEVVCSGAFWRGVADGLAPQRNLFAPWSCSNLARSNTFEYAWYSVGQALNQSLDEAAGIYEWSEGPDIRDDGLVGPGTKPIEGCGNGATSGWFPVADYDADADAA